MAHNAHATVIKNKHEKIERNTIVYHLRKSNKKHISIKLYIKILSNHIYFHKL